MGAGDTLLQRTWQLLDNLMVEIMDERPEPGHDTTRWLQAKSEARGVAKVLAMFMVPHFNTADEVAEEAVRRYKARMAGEEYETKGIGVRAYETPPPSRDLVAEKKAGKKAATKKATGKTGNRIPESAVNTSLQGIVSGMFTAEQIGQMYKMSASEVKTQLGIA